MSARSPLPPACSLLQAALWVARKEQPIPDEIFDAAPLRLEPQEIEPFGPLRSLLLALRRGDLLARAHFSLMQNVGWGDSDNWTEHSSAYQVRLPKEFWSWQHVDWQNSEISGIEFPPHPFGGYLEDQHQELQRLEDASSVLEEDGVRQKLIISSIQVHVPRLLSLFPGDLDLEQGLCSSEALPTEGHVPHYVPPYVEFMLRASRELGLKPDERVPKDKIIYWIEQNWPKDWVRPSKTKLEYLSTFLRRLEDEQGGNLPKRQIRRVRQKKPL
jgi:hypothetical protein